MSTSEIEIELQRLYEAAGNKLTPEEVVKAAKDPENPLHSKFNWNDKEAAHEWRLETARRLIRSIKIQVTVQETRMLVPAFVRDPGANPDEQGYKSVADIADGPRFQAARAAEHELRQAMGHLVRARDLATTLGFGHLVEAAIESVMNANVEIKSAPRVA